MKVVINSGVIQPPPRVDRSYGVGPALRDMRKAAGQKQSYVAETLGFSSTSTVSKIEQGATSVTIEQVIVIAKLFGYEVNISFSPISKPSKRK